MPARPKGPFLERIPDEVAAIFAQAQASSVNHRKNSVALHNIHDAAAHIHTKHRNGGYKLVGENVFQKIVLQHIFRTLPYRRGFSAADLVGRFIGLYTKVLNEKAQEEQMQLLEDGAITQDEVTYGNRFTAKISTELLKGFDAKDKNVRYRSMYVFAEMVKHLGEIQEALYENLRTGLLERMNDKEPSIRALAVTCVAILCKEETSGDLNPGEITVEQALLEALSTDNSSEARKAILSNIQVNPRTLPHIVERGRDNDAVVRRLVYHQVLKRAIFKKKPEDEEEPGYGHPRRLSVRHLETIIDKGLRDREPSVCAAATSLINEWVMALELNPVKPEPDDNDRNDEPTERVEHGVISLLERFGVTNRDAEQLSVVERVLQVIFASRHDICDGLEFEADYWRVIGPENALLSRVFVEWCKVKNNTTRLETILPVVSDMQLNIKSHYTYLAHLYDQEMEDEETDHLRERVFILGELLKFAAKLDYTDHSGYQKMLPTVRTISSDTRLPIILLPPCLDVLRSLAASEQEFIRIVNEIIQELRDVAEPEATLDAEGCASILQEDREMSEEINARCLTMSIHMLERIESASGEHFTLRLLFDSLIFPSLNKVAGGSVPEDAITGMGLYALIDKHMAPRVLQICIDLVCSAHPDTNPDVTIAVFKTIFDLIIYHGDEIYAQRVSSDKTMAQIHDILIRQLGESNDVLVLVLICQGLVKMILSGQLPQPTAVINLFKAYVCPDTQDCQQLVQCLTYFFNAYSHSSPTNQETMRKIFMDVFKSVANDRANLEEDQEIITPAKLCMTFAYLTNPEILESNLIENTKSLAKDVNYSIQLDLAHDILKELFETQTKFKREEKKALFQILPKLYLPDEGNELTIVNIKFLVDTLKTCHPPKDGPSRNALKKFEDNIMKKYEKQLEGISEEEYRKWESLQDLFEFFDDLIPDDDDSMLDAPENLSKGRKRRSRSSATTTTENGRDSSAEGRPRAKRPRYNRSSAGSDDDGDGRSTRHGTRRASTKADPDPSIRSCAVAPKTPAPEPEYIYVSSDEEVIEPRKSYRKYSSCGVKQEEREEDIDADISNLLRSQLSTADITQETLFSASEDEEDEVSGILSV